MTSPSFGCDKCSVTFATIDEGVHHLRTVLHHAEAVELLLKLDIDFRTAAANYLLFSFTRNSRTDHELAVADGMSASRTLVGQNPHLIGDDDNRGPAKRHCLEPPVLAVDVYLSATLRKLITFVNIPQRSTRTQSLVDAPNVARNGFIEPLKIFVLLTINSATPTKVFPCNFMRTRHTTISMLLEAVAASYKGLHDIDVDMEAVAGRGLVMHMLKDGVPSIGGLVEDDDDLSRILAMDGAGWYGKLEIG